jgi:hypothetical protein
MHLAVACGLFAPSKVAIAVSRPQTRRLTRRLLKPKSGNSYKRMPKGWLPQCKVNDHRVCIVIEDGTLYAFSQAGEKYTKVDLSQFQPDLERMDTHVFDCGVMGVAYGHKEHPIALIVHDLPLLRKPFHKRHDAIKCDMYHMYSTPKGVSKLKMMEPSMMPKHWMCMQEYNDNCGYPLYEGFVCKNPESDYPFMTNRKAFPHWIKYRFDQLN